MTASAEWAYQPAVPDAVLSPGLGAPQRPRLASRPRDTMDHKSLSCVDGLRPSAEADGYIQPTISGTIWPGPRWLDDLLATEMGDAGCELTFVLLDRYAEAQLSGHNPQVSFRGIAVHLRSCPACHEDLTGLRLALPAS